MAATGEQFRGVTRYLDAAPALLLGVLGCVAVEALTARLLTHSHAAAHGVAAGAPHVYDRATASALFIACLLLVAGAAAVAAAGRRRATRSAVMWASGLSISAFAVMDVVAYGMSGAPHPTSPLLLLTGGVAHACVGAGVGLLWWHWLDGVRRPAAHPRSEHPAWPRRAEPPRHPVRLRRRWWATSIAGRGPPFRLA